MKKSMHSLRERWDEDFSSWRHIGFHISVFQIKSSGEVKISNSVFSIWTTNQYRISDQHQRIIETGADTLTDHLRKEVKYLVGDPRSGGCPLNQYAAVGAARWQTLLVILFHAFRSMTLVFVYSRLRHRDSNFSSFRFTLVFFGSRR